MPSKPCQPAGHDSDLSDAKWEFIKPVSTPPTPTALEERLRTPDSARRDVFETHRSTTRTMALIIISAPAMRQRSTRAPRCCSVFLNQCPIIHTSATLNSPRAA